MNTHMAIIGSSESIEVKDLVQHIQECEPHVAYEPLSSFSNFLLRPLKETGPLFSASKL